MEENLYKVYIKIDKNNCITNIESSISSDYIDFSKDWIEIDEGTGDKYVHAQNNYFNQNTPLRDSKGRCNYKHEEYKILELTDEEKEKLYPIPKPQPTTEELLQKQLLETQNMLLELQEQILLNKQI